MLIDRLASGKGRYMSKIVKVETEIEVLDSKELLDLILNSLIKRDFISKYSNETEQALSIFAPLKGKLAQSIYNHCKYQGLSLECDRPVTIEKKAKTTKKTKK